MYPLISSWASQLFLHADYCETAVINMGMQGSLLYIDLHSFRNISKERGTQIGCHG
jgi:hypothetical protein